MNTDELIKALLDLDSPFRGERYPMEYREGYNDGWEIGARAVGEPLAAALREALDGLGFLEGHLDTRGFGFSVVCETQNKIRSILQSAVGEEK